MDDPAPQGGGGGEHSTVRSPPVEVRWWWVALAALAAVACVHRANSWQGYVGVTCLVLVTLLFGAMLLVPTWFLTGVRTFDGGFETYQGIRGARTILLADITALVAVCRNEGEDGEAVDFSIQAGPITVTVPEFDLYHTGLIHQLKALPGFDADAYRAALNCQVRWYERLTSRRFPLYRRA